MFDDQTQGGGTPAGGQVPSNLPMGEPDDMFAGVDAAVDEVVPKPQVVPQAPSPVIPEPVVAMPTAMPSVEETPIDTSLGNETALNAGVLRPVGDSSIPPVSAPAPTPPVAAPALSVPKERVEQPPYIPNYKTEATDNQPHIDRGPAVQTPPPLAQASAAYALKEPSLSKGIMTVIIIFVVFTILGFGGWWIYNAIIKTNAPSETPTFVTDESVTPTDVNNNDTNEITPSVEGSALVLPDINTDDSVLFGQPIDTDGDTIDDDRELAIGTDPNDWDSDNDGLSDGDEIIIWKTDPNNPDTDGDTYLDGAEVKAGYNPNGPGRIFEVPKENNDVTNGTDEALDQKKIDETNTDDSTNVDLSILEASPFQSFGSCDKKQVNAFVLESVEALKSSGYEVTSSVWDDQELFPILVNDLRTRLEACNS